VAGDAVDDLAGTTALIPHEMPVVIITSWVLMYLPPAERTRFLNELDRLARRRRIWWVANETFESCLVEVAPQYADLAYTRTGQTALSLMGWDDRGWHVQVFGTAQVHGDAMTILDDEPTSDRSWFTEHRP
jgi:O-methyltransferase involved in polyketide biosynthesis